MRWNACICDKKNYHSYCWLCMRCEYNRLLRSFFQHLSESFYHFIIAWKWERNKIRTAHKGRVGKKMVHRQRHQVNYFRFAYKKSELRISLISFVIIHTSVDNFLGQFFFCIFLRQIIYGHWHLAVVSVLLTNIIIQPTDAMRIVFDFN